MAKLEEVAVLYTYSMVQGLITDAVAPIADRCAELEAERDAALQQNVHDEGTIARLEAERDAARKEKSWLTDCISLLQRRVEGAQAERNAARNVVAELLGESIFYLGPDSMLYLEERIEISSFGDLAEFMSTRSEPDPSTSDRSDPSPNPNRRQTGS